MASKFSITGEFCSLEFFEQNESETCLVAWREVHKF